jgi:hypothetical protein
MIFGRCRVDVLGVVSELTGQLLFGMATRGRLEFGLH